MMGDGARTGIILFAHGSRVEEANRGVQELAQQVQIAGGLAYVRAAFLEMAQPDLAAAVGQAAQIGLKRLIIVPYFLTAGTHLQRDLPDLIAREQQKHPGLAIDVCDSLEGHPLMPSLILDRVRSAWRNPAR